MPVLHDVQVEIQGLSQIVRAFERSPQIAESEMQKAINTVPDILAKWTTPATNGGTVPYRTGFLVETFQKSTSRLMARWFPTREYAGYVELGTRFMKANPYMERILSRSKGEINELFSRALTAVSDRIAKESKS